MSSNFAQQIGYDTDAIILEMMSLFGRQLLTTGDYKFQNFTNDSTKDWNKINFEGIVTDVFIPMIKGNAIGQTSFGDSNPSGNATATNDICYSLHGNIYLTETKGTFGVKYSSVPKNVSSLDMDVYRTLKGCIESLLLGDTNGFYYNLEKLSMCKKDAMAKNNKTNRVQRQTNYITNQKLFKL